MYYQLPSFEIMADNFTRLSVFDSTEGSSNTFKTRKNISWHFKKRHLVTYKYEFYLSYESYIPKHES